MDWRNLWPYARTWWGWTVAGFTAFFALFYGPKKMLETWEWYMDRLFDWKVREFLERSVISKQGSYGQTFKWRVPKSVQEIAAATRFSERRVKACLKRLKKRGLIVEDEKGSRLNV